MKKLKMIKLLSILFLFMAFLIFKNLINTYASMDNPYRFLPEPEPAVPGPTVCENLQGKLNELASTMDLFCFAAGLSCAVYNDCHDILDCTNTDVPDQDPEDYCNSLNNCGGTSCNYSFENDMCQQSPENNQALCPYFEPFPFIGIGVCKFFNSNSSSENDNIFNICFHQKNCKEAIAKYNGAASEYNSQCGPSTPYNGENLPDDFEWEDCKRGSQSLCTPFQFPFNSPDIIPKIPAILQDDQDEDVI